MDRRLRESERAASRGDLTRLGVELLRAGRRERALERLAEAWGHGEPAAPGIFQEVCESLDHTERLSSARHLDRLACAGCGEAQAFWRRWFPAATRIVGTTMRPVREFLYQHARSKAPILLHGESGVGINLCAEVLHALRGEGRFEREYVSAMGLSLWEDALRRFEAAPQGSTIACTYARPDDGPTAWLDRLLRSSAATGSQLVVGGLGDDDVWSPALIRCRVPPLRERFEDLPALTEHLLKRHGEQEPLSEAALAHLRAHAWFGNVRELDHVLHRAVILAASGSVSAEVLAWTIPNLERADGGSSNPSTDLCS